MIQNLSTIIALIGISGTGKSHLLSHAINSDSSNRVFRLIAATTRPPRVNEVNGIDKIFLTKNEFNDRLDSFCCINDVYGNKYAYFKKDFHTGNTYLCEFYYKELPTLADAAHNHIITIYVKPSSIDRVLHAIDKRSKNSKENQFRKNSLLEEYKDLEILFSSGKFDYSFINDYTSDSERRFVNLLAEILSTNYGGTK